MSDNRGTIGIEWSVAAIQVGTRHRRDHGEMRPLVASIERYGLLQPLTITPEGFLICGARRLAAIKILGWKTVRVWIRSGLSDRLGQLLAEQDENVLHKPLTPLEATGLYRELKALLEEDAKKRQELTQFHEGHKPGEHGGGNLPAPATSAYGESRAQAAAMVPGGVSYRTFDKIGYLEKVADDETMPDELRGRAQAELEQVNAGAPVSPAYERIHGEVDEEFANKQAELHQLAEEALARVKAEHRAKRKKLRKPPMVRRSDGPFPTRAFVLTWTELTDWWESYDLHQLAVELTAEQIDDFHTALTGSNTFAKQLDTERENVPIEQRGKPLNRRAHLRAL
ncbi:MAG TPA: ParB N-terminal domain-containing protein [Lacisediminihabitans sp.]|uniref:ParB N-terminal domain-containing protein n=1 Tax=Lacisediminihabitans sp. TaxID=2787631 RepID=UPI002EDA3CD1